MRAPLCLLLLLGCGVPGAESGTEVDVQTKLGVTATTEVCRKPAGLNDAWGFSSYAGQPAFASVDWERDARALAFRVVERMRASGADPRDFADWVGEGCAGEQAAVLTVRSVELVDSALDAARVELVDAGLRGAFVIHVGQLTWPVAY